MLNQERSRRLRLEERMRTVNLMDELHAGGPRPRWHPIGGASVAEIATKDTRIAVRMARFMARSF